jgi:hypothetical protein
MGVAGGVVGGDGASRNFEALGIGLIGKSNGIRKGVKDGFAIIRESTFGRI